MQGDSRNNLRIIIAFVIVVVMIIIGYFIYTSVSRSDKIPVTINAVPSDARITLNDVEVSTGTVYLKPGGYKTKATNFF